MIVLDATIVNVALPSIQSDLGFAQSSLAWVVNAYLIAFGGALLLAGRLGDLFGQRRVFLAGLAVFSAASLVCGLSTGQEMLVMARFIQGVVGAFLVTAALLLGVYTIIRTTDFGWGSAQTLGFGAAATASLIAFVVRESRIANPLVPLRIFRSRDVSGANVVLLLIFAAMFG